MSGNFRAISCKHYSVAVDTAGAGTVLYAITGHSIGKHHKLSARKRVGRRRKQIVGGSLSLLLSDLHVGGRARLWFRLIQPHKS